MSAAFKNAKKKLPQSELRRIMNDHKIKKTTKIESPLAKYNDLGQLTCVLCQSIVRSEGVWNVHINSKQHRDKVEEARRLKETTNNFTTNPKRSLEVPIEVPTKKIKGILKNSKTSTHDNDASNTEISSNVGNAVTFKEVSVDPVSNKQDEQMVIDPKDDQSAIPEGFFDDPKQDAKVRHIDYKDPVEEEWERFQKAIRDANNESANIIAEDHEEATNERQIDEIDEQMKNWSKVLTLEKRKLELTTTTNTFENMDADLSEDSADDVEFEEYVDWRTKKFLR
ncbi:zinc finger protein 830 isoform X2 [Photinus pyralis]|uniref:Zinc finger protein 830 n=1 Tax=Photinus pyralis TaxID=7054 RepID=A0A1Y1NFL8_PHOPY|nr:zinc finger protein 830 isoform X2 [Photinus pyralis]